MADLKLKAKPRQVLGKKTRFLRNQGITPVHVFGNKLESLALECDTKELQHLIAKVGTTRLFSLVIDTKEKEKEPRNVFIREIQRNAISGQLLHVDLYQVLKTQRIKMDVPIVLVGDSPATRKKGQVLTQPLTELNLEGLPDKLPPQVEVDISSLTDVDQALFVRDIKLDPEVTVFNEPDLTVVKVIMIREEEKVEVPKPVEAEAAAPAEGEAKAEAPAKEEAAKATKEEPKKKKGE
jgi:large subunit ribosomal protein L25